MAIQQEKPRFRARAWKSFVTSSWLTAIWEWFLSLAGRAVQLVLFITVMYNLVSTYPGFKAPWAGLDIISFILQNVALDVGSFGLPKLAAQAEKDGNAEGAENARKVAKALFLILISNLIWGGVEHVFPGIPEALKTVAGLGFVIIRAYYAAEYMKVIHGLDKHEEPTPGAGVAPVAQVVPAPAIDYAALALELRPYLDSMRAGLVVDLKPVVPDLDYLALAKMVVPHVEAMMVDLSLVALAPSPVDLKRVDLKPVPVAPSPVDLALTPVDLSPVEPASSPVALASAQVASSPVPPQEPGPAPLVKARSSGSQVALAGGSELEKSSKAGPESTKESLKAGPVTAKSSNEERDRKLEIAYAAMVAESAAISGRTLAARARCARPAATEWLRLLLQVAPGGPESSSGLEATGPESITRGFKSSTSGSGFGMSGPESSGPGSDEVDLKPRSRVRNTDELVALDLEVSNA